MIALALLSVLATAKPYSSGQQCLKPATTQECAGRLDSLAKEVAFMQKVLESKGIDFEQERRRLALADSSFDIPHEPAMILGLANAKHTLTVFTDPQCPYCLRLVPQLDVWIAQHSDLRVAIHTFPLSFHERALPASKAYWAAAKQNKFPGFFRTLHANGSKDLSDAAIDRAATASGLDLGRFHADMASDAAQNSIQSDMELAQRVGVEGTPSLYLDGRMTRDPETDLSKLK